MADFETVTVETDLLLCGGGMAGVCAALAAALGATARLVPGDPAVEVLQGPEALGDLAAGRRTTMLLKGLLQVAPRPARSASSLASGVNCS